MRYNFSAAGAAVGLPNLVPPNQLTSMFMQQSSGRTAPVPRSRLKKAVTRQKQLLLKLDEQCQNKLDELREFSVAARAKIDEHGKDIVSKEDKLRSISRNNRDIKKKFMMGIFQEYTKELREFQDYIDTTSKKK